MNALLLLMMYCAIIVAVSLAGGRLSSLFRMTHLRTQLLMSGVGGLMLGIAMLHLMPHAAGSLGSASKAGTGGLAGLTVMFLLVRLFHTHDHGVQVVVDDEGESELPADTPQAAFCIGHDGAAKVRIAISSCLQNKFEPCFTCIRIAYAV